jgi:hypothetical protein
MIDKLDLPDVAITDVVNENEATFEDMMEHIDGLDLDEAGKSQPEPVAPSPLNPLLLLGSLECKWPIGVADDLAAAQGLPADTEAACHAGFAQ